MAKYFIKIICNNILLFKCPIQLLQSIIRFIEAVLINVYLKELN